jgi:3',5'-nucleoside bisphosphate phosphatase
VAGAVDLHSHTTASDGTLAPRELVRLAARHGVRVLAVTDHDSTGGLADAIDEARRLPPLEIVPGLEINCDVPGAEIHVLGYCVDWEAAWFQEFLGAQREERRQRVHRIAQRLAELGMPIEPAEVFALVREGSAGRPHVAQVMVDRGYVKSVREAFDRYLSANGPANVPRKRFTPVEAVRIIRCARGVPVLAHPGLANRDEMIPALVEAGLLGIEAFYPEHSPAQTTAYREMCSRLGLIATGGSDFHGPSVGGARHPGVQPVPESAWQELRSRLASLAGEPPSAPPSPSPPSLPSTAP